MKFLFSRSRAATAPLAPPAGVDASTSDADDSVITMDPALLTDDDADQDSQLDNVECINSEAAASHSAEEPAAIAPTQAPVEQLSPAYTDPQDSAASLECGTPESLSLDTVAADANPLSSAALDSVQSAALSAPSAQQLAAADTKAPRAKAAAKPRAEPKPKSAAKPKAATKRANKAPDQEATADGSPAAKPRRIPAKRGLNMSLSTGDWILPGDPRAPIMKIVYPKEDSVPATEEPQDVLQHIGGQA